MDSAPYHSVKLIKFPTSNSNKAELCKFLSDHQIKHTSSTKNCDLYTKVKEYNRANPHGGKYEIDEIAKAAGHKVLRLPPYHCELNPIEMAWAQVKGYIARNNTTYKLGGC